MAALGVGLCVLAPAGSGQGGTVPAEGTLQVRLPSPTAFALLRHRDGRGTLHAVGDAVTDHDQPARALIVDRIAADGVVLRRAAAGSVPQVLKQGRAAPALGGLVFVRAVTIDEVEYRYRSVEGAASPDPLIVALDGSRAVLEIEVSRRAAARNVRFHREDLGDASPVKDPLDTLAQIPVQRVGPNTYEIRAGYWRAIRWATDTLGSTVRPAFFLEGGPGLSIASEAAEGALNARGLVVTQPKLAARVGMEVGDVIVRVNGQPVTGLDSAMQIASQTRSAPPSTLRVDIERRGRPLTLTYRLK
jgi:hypothetical protein